MIEKQVQSILRELTEQKAPKAKIDLWPAIESCLIKSNLKTSKPSKIREPQINTRQHRTPQLHLAATIALVAIFVCALFFVTPQGQVIAQNIFHVFSRSESNQLPIQTWQLTPSSNEANPISDPASIIDAELSIEEAQQHAGYNVFVPSWIPDNLDFSGASVDQESKIIRIFYRFFDTNGLVFKQELIPIADACELCGKVGTDAAIQEVSIAGTYGEYVEGVWKLTDEGPVWDDIPYLKTMRWQKEGMAFELLYMGPPDTLSKEEMIAIAESIK
jgi:hypothetical protein